MSTTVMINGRYETQCGANTKANLKVPFDIRGQRLTKKLGFETTSADVDIEAGNIVIVVDEK
jgi:hypothetical protein